MRNILYWFVAALLALHVQVGFSQSHTFIATEEAVMNGIRLVPRSARKNAQFIRLKQPSGDTTFYPNQLKAYGFQSGEVFISKDITVKGEHKRVFLERLVEGELDLYYYTEKGLRTYFLSQDTATLIEISRHDFRTKVYELTSSYDWRFNQVRLARYRQRSLTKVITMHNDTIRKRIVFPRFGFQAGYATVSLSKPIIFPVTQLSAVDFSPVSAVVFGFFGDFPILMSDFSFNVGVNYSKFGFSISSETATSDIDVVINVTSLTMPLLLRYTLPAESWKPFFSTGPVYSFQPRNESGIYETLIGQNVLTINEAEETVISKNMGGFSISAGLLGYLGYRKTAALELRYSRLYGKKQTLVRSHFEILTSVSF